MMSVVCIFSCKSVQKFKSVFWIHIFLMVYTVVLCFTHMRTHMRTQMVPIPKYIRISCMLCVRATKTFAVFPMWKFPVRFSQTRL